MYLSTGRYVQTKAINAIEHSIDITEHSITAIQRVTYDIKTKNSRL